MGNIGIEFTARGAAGFCDLGAAAGARPDGDSHVHALLRCDERH